MRAKSIVGIALAGLGLVAALGLSSCTLSASSITSPRYALVYGVKNYLSGSLNYTVADAEGIRDLLEARGVSSSNMIEREDTAVTKAQIKADILSLSSISSDSTVVIYYSGHGTFADSSWGADYPSYSGAYIVPYDAVSSSGLTSSTLQYLISPTELESWISQMGTKNVIVALDSCYSGGFSSAGSATDSAPSDYSSLASFSAFSTAISNFGDLLVANASASGAKTPIVIAAAGSEEYSWDGTSTMGHGVFTYYFLKSATSGDSNEDGYVTATEAYTYAHNQVKNVWDSSSNLRYIWQTTGTIYYPFLPHISGGNRDLVLFTK